jgi:hypothetical protein
MGQCAMICSNHCNKANEIQVEMLGDGKKIIKNKLLAQQISSSPNYPKLIYLQLRIKRFLKRKHYKSKKGIPTKQNNNINVNINLNVNMENNKNIEETNQAKPAQLSLGNNATSNEVKMQTSGITTTNSNVHINTIDNQNNNISRPNINQPQTQQQPSSIGGDNIVIPSVKAEFRESILFSTDPFLKHKKTLGDNSDDPRLGPNDNVRRKYPTIREDDSTYTGEWKNGMRDGYGILVWKDISKYIGEFVDNKVSGFGKFYYEEGDTYTGYWVNFQANGVGIFKTTKDASYQGYWLNDKQDSFGIENWPRGSSYTGEYKNGNKEGIGLLNFEGNGGYEGQFEEGSISGIGTFYFNDNRKYEGEWLNNKMHGHGIITWPDGKFFEGQFIDDRKEGFGVFYSSRKIYLGVWKGSAPEGETIIIENGTVKKQFWENGRAVRQLPKDHSIFFEKYVDEIIQYTRNIVG